MWIYLLQLLSIDGDRRVEYRTTERSPALDPMAQLTMLTKQERKTAFGNAEPNVILSDFDADAINEGYQRQSGSNLCGLACCKD
jgi:hypothetical protein